jgi:hypothetical protein
MRKSKKLNFPYLAHPVDRFMICDKGGVLKTLIQILGDKEPHQELRDIMLSNKLLSKNDDT